MDGESKQVKASVQFKGRKGMPNAVALFPVGMFPHASFDKLNQQTPKMDNKVLVGYYIYHQFVVESARVGNPVPIKTIILRMVKDPCKNSILLQMVLNDADKHRLLCRIITGHFCCDMWQLPKLLTQSNCMKCLFYIELVCSGSVTNEGSLY
ncbi:hypothetical protein TNCV_4762751 [Trichonephila clavipes]|nr:hypothetical protein TNCV_4762751 [Trichonephila clavipes]